MADATGQTSDLQTRGWHAWIDRMPPSPARLHVVGEVRVGNLGIEPLLVFGDAPGAASGSLQVHLFPVQRPGPWPAVVVWVNATFEKALIPSEPSLDTVEVLYADERLATLPVAAAE